LRSSCFLSFVSDRSAAHTLLFAVGALAAA
jgi:hypothetical protein